MSRSQAGVADSATSNLTYILQSEGARHFAFLARDGRPFGPKLGPYRSREAAAGIATTMIRVAAYLRAHPPAANGNRAPAGAEPSARHPKPPP